MADHKRIWLQHPSDADPDVGRMWCEDKVWPDAPEEGEPTEYIRADIAQGLAEALSNVIDRVEKWEAAVRQIIGRTPMTGMNLSDAKAALAKARGE